MQRTVVATLVGLALTGPAAAQVPNVQQLLQGLTTGNQGQDQALRDAFERGYQRGRQDEAQLQQSRRGQGDRGDRNTYQRGTTSDRNGGSYGQDRGSNRDRQRGSDQPYDRRGSPDDDR